VSVGASDEFLRFWDVHAGHLLLSLPIGATGSVTCLSTFVTALPGQALHAVEPSSARMFVNADSCCKSGCHPHLLLCLVCMSLSLSPPQPPACPHGLANP
jgi:hypothetical protein